MYFWTEETVGIDSYFHWKLGTWPVLCISYLTNISYPPTFPWDLLLSHPMISTPELGLNNHICNFWSFLYDWPESLPIPSLLRVNNILLKILILNIADN